MNKTGILLGAAIGWLAQGLYAQPAGALPEFEIASVKANHSTEGGGMRQSTGLLTVVNAPLLKIVSAAFGSNEDRDAYQIDGPDWMRSERYDIVAKFPGDTRADQMRLMLQSLLKERFKMSFHRETRNMPVYALVVAKGGLKANAAASGASPGFRRGVGHLASQLATMSALADKLSQQSDRPVVDATGIQGAYAFTLDWAKDQPVIDAGGGVSLYTALQEQLGLRLEARKEPMEVVVIDRIERAPTSN